MQAWIPLKATDPDSLQEIIQLRQQVAELRQRVGDDSYGAPPASSPAPASSAAHLSPIQRSFQGRMLHQLHHPLNQRAFSPSRATATPGWKTIFPPAWPNAPLPIGSISLTCLKPRRTRFRQIWRRPKLGGLNNQLALWTPFRRWQS